jgi:hypothetical protein
MMWPLLMGQFGNIFKILGRAAESRNIGARVYDRFLDNGLAKRLHNRIAPVSIQRKHLYNNRGMLLRYSALVGSVSVTTELLYNVFQIQERRH